MINKSNPMTLFKNIFLNFSILVFLQFFISCSFYSNIENMVSPNSKEENKLIWYTEIRSIEPTSDIHNINGYYENQYVQTVPAFIDTFTNDKNFLFAFYADGGVLEEWILLGRKIDSLYIISFIHCYHGTVRFKGYTQLDDILFERLIDSANSIIVDKNNYFGSPLYLDSLLYKECELDTIFQNTNAEVNTFYPLEHPNKGYETFGIIRNHYCVGRQIFGVFINNISNSFTYLNNYSDKETDLNVKNSFARSTTEKLWGILFDFEWIKTYED